MKLAFPLLCLLLTSSSCSRRPVPPARQAAADTAAARAIARDRPERLVLPLGPAGAGQVAYEAVAPVRAALDVSAAGRTLELPPPAAEIAPPPADSALPPGATVPLDLKPPIPRGRPLLPRGGRGGSVTLDVRVDESGEVSDV